MKAITDPQPSTNRWLATQAATVRGPLALAILAGVLAGLFTIAQAGLLAWLLAGLLDGQTVPLASTLFSLLAVVLLRVAAGWGRDAAGLIAADRVIAALRQRLANHLAALGPVHLAEYPPGQLASAWLEQTQALEGYYARFLPQTLLALLVPMLLLAAIITQDWLAAALLAFSAPLIPLFMALIGMGAAQISQRQQAAVARAGGHFLDRLRGLTTLRLFGYAERAADEVQAVADDYRDHTMKTLRVAFLSSAVLEFFAAVAVAMVAIYIGFALLGSIQFGPAGELTLFGGLFILLLAPEFFLPLRQLASHYHDRADALGAAAELQPLLAAEGRLADPAEPCWTGAALRLDQVAVHYPDGRCGLQALSLSVAEGERVVLRGASGAGKSTLLALLAGFLSPSAGRLCVSGPVALMGQRTHLFSATIADNIRLARPEASDEAIAAVARRAGVLAFAQRLPEGLETPIGEGGVPLSGGQAQRVALARTLLMQAPILLLDEPTAGLDPAGEEALITTLEQALPAQQTVLIATHHPRLQALGQRQLWLEQGKLQGNNHA